jgi:hypothetical protein
VLDSCVWCGESVVGLVSPRVGPRCLGRSSLHEQWFSIVKGTVSMDQTFIMNRCRVDYLLSVSFAGSDFIRAIPTRFDQVREFPFKEERGEKLID